MNCKNKLKISEVINPNIVLRAEFILYKLPIEPMIFCTARDSIQLEYKKYNGDYLELEIYENKLDCLIIENNKEEKIFNITEEFFIGKLNSFFR